jgi:hypothetical protein
MSRLMVGLMSDLIVKLYLYIYDFYAISINYENFNN